MNVTDEKNEEVRNYDLREEIEEEQGNYVHKISFVEVLYGTVVSPKETFTMISKKPPLMLSILTVFLIYLFTWLLNLSELRDAHLEISQEMISSVGYALPFDAFGSMIAVMGLMGVIMSLLVWFVISGALNLWAVLLGGTGNARGLFVCYGFSFLPMVFTEVLQKLIYLTGLPGFLGFLFTVAGFVWVIYLQTISIRVTQKLSSGRSLLVALSPMLLAILLMLLMFILFFAAIFPMLIRFMPM